MTLWETTAPIWVGGREVAAGKPVSLSAAQSKYLKHALKAPEPEAVPEVEVAVEAVADEAEPAPKASRRKRKDAEDGDVD